MTLKQSRLDSSAGDIASRGKVDLPKKNRSGRHRPGGGRSSLEFNGTGTLADPKVRLSARGLRPASTSSQRGQPAQKHPEGRFRRGSRRG